jgi:hypothetical protein
MADFTTLSTTTAYSSLLPQISGRDDDLAMMLDPAYSTPSNLKTNAQRLNSALGKFQRYNGTSWVDALSSWNITGTLSSSGNATFGDGTTSGALNVYVNSPAANNAQLNWQSASSTKWSLYRVATTHALQLDSNNKSAVLSFDNTSGVMSVGYGAAVTGAVTSAGAFVTTGNTGGVAGSMYKVGTSGLTLQPVTGSSYDFAITNAAASAFILTNPTGTNNLSAGGNLTVAGTLSASNDFTLSTNATYFKGKNTTGSTGRLFGINGVNNVYIGDIDNIGANGMYLEVQGTAAMTLTTTSATLPGALNSSGIFTNTNSDNTSSIKTMLQLQRGTGGGVVGTINTTGDASNGVASMSLQVGSGALSINSSNVSVTGPLNESSGSNIASAATINLTSATGNGVHVTGTTAITAVTLGAGMRRTVIFDGALTLTHHATNNNLPNGLNINTAAGDRATYWSDGTTVYCIAYTYATGYAVSAGNALPPANTVASFSHGLGVMPRAWKISIVCATAEQGYSVGDEIDITTLIDGDGTRMTTCWANSTTIGYITADASGALFIHSRSTSNAVAITPANWTLTFRAWK